MIRAYGRVREAKEDDRIYTNEFSFTTYGSYGYNLYDRLFKVRRHYVRYNVDLWGN